jgi:hypothetical protein
VVDTRNGAALQSGLVGRTGAAPLVVPMGPSSDVPAGASSVALNVTVVNPAAAGYLTAYPCSAPMPNASNVNFRPGEIRPNLAVVRIGSAGNVCIRSTAAADIVVDLVGWFQ